MYVGARTAEEEFGHLGFEYLEAVSNPLDDIVAGRLILECGTGYTSTN